MSEAIDQARHISGAEAVIDVDDRHVAGATVEHAQQRGEAVEASAVADASGDGDYGAGDEAANGAGQRAFHSGTDHHDARFRQTRTILQEAMNASDTDVVDGFHLITHDFGGDLRFLRDRNVARAGADDGDFAFAA